MKKKLNLNLKQQITLMISLALIVPPALVGFVSIYRIQKEARADIEEFRTDELNKLKLYLKHITDIAYGIVEVSNQSARDSASNAPDAMKVTLAELSRVRFDKGEGYFWVTDNKLPYPTMLMHAEKPELNGKVLDDPKYNVEKYDSRNIYQVRAELSNANGDAYVEYVMRKPGTEEVFNKISYSWQLTPYSLGGWAVYTAETRSSVYKAFEKPDENVFFAGEHTTYLNAWMAGAFESARKAVTSVHARATGTTIEYPTQKK